MDYITCGAASQTTENPSSSGDGDEKEKAAHAIHLRHGYGGQGREGAKKTQSYIGVDASHSFVMHMWGGLRRPAPYSALRARRNPPSP